VGILDDFISRVVKTHQTGAATEHSYRPSLETLISSLADEVTALNEPKRVACGAPDFIVQRKSIVIGHIEAKDVGISLTKLSDSNKAQQTRYLKALPNLIYTNCLDWQFFRNEKLIASISIGSLTEGIQVDSRQFASLENLLRDFIAQKPQTITSPKVLAEMMAGKAVLIKDVLRLALEDDVIGETALTGQYKAFSEHLIHDISAEEFADLYAETIAYGMFAARLHDKSLNGFSRQEALDLLPKSNPFLRSLFGYIAGPDLDERIRWIIDDLADVFQAANVHTLMQGFGKLTGQSDPFLHFYETFLAAYNPAKRKARGVWYTPEAVVNFIVRAVDEVLQNEFGLADGLADTSRITVDWDTGQADKKGKPVFTRKEVHRVQILDPATGTGTFLAEVIKHIAPKVKDVAEGMWSGYIERDLIPRLHGFELLMASYAMCHMKLDMILTELGYQPSKEPPRLGVYLTNSLEEGERDVRDLFMAKWLTREAREASTVKRQTPIMCVLGNPPYSGVSNNKGAWITGLIEDYKYIDGVHFGERKHWLQDDYVKFIRFAEHMIEKTGEGIVGMITNHGYLDNPTFRGMRWHLLNTFDKIYVLDLHGNSNRKEVAPDGSADKNVFDIQQGVAIVIGVKKKLNTQNNGSKPLAQVFSGDLWGSRATKYERLSKGSLFKEVCLPVNYQAPEYAFVQRDRSMQRVYEEGFSINDFMPVNVTGIVSMGDGFAIANSAAELEARMQNFLTTEITASELNHRYQLGKNYSEWILGNKAALKTAELKPVPIDYRPFDRRWTYFDNRVLWRWREKVLRHVVQRENFSLIYSRQAAQGDSGYNHVLVSSHLFDNRGVYSNKGISQASPLYLYPSQQDLDQTKRINFDPVLYARLQAMATDATRGTPDEVAVFDYVYGVLHRPSYRHTYAEFLKSDFPRIPWPSSPTEFWTTADVGSQLRRLHLLEPAAVGAVAYPFKGTGPGTVEQARFDNDRIWINATQYFDAVPALAWDFYIGGYQPAQKWLKDRKGQTLSFDEVKHYQRILKVLAETHRIMNEIA
jgi:Type ISP C-terminal specificity domain/N-6 DNA Methylase